MNKFFGEILVLIGSIALIFIPLVGGGTIIYALFNHQLGILTETSFPLGWGALILTVFSHIYCFVYSIYSLRVISLGRSSKKSLFISLPFIIVEIARCVFIYVNFLSFAFDNMFNILMILTFIFYFIQLCGFILNYKKRI